MDQITLRYKPLVGAPIQAGVVSPTVQPRPWVLGTVMFPRTFTYPYYTAED